MEIPEYHQYWHEVVGCVEKIWHCTGRKYFNGKPGNFTYELICEKFLGSDSSGFGWMEKLEERWKAQTQES